VAAHAVSVSPAARLFERYGEQLYRFCLSRMRSREEAEDAVQSTFLRVHKALAKGVVPEYEAAWLYKIAHNVCLSRRAVLARGGQVIPLHDHDGADIELPAPEGRRDELFGLEDALAELAPNLRQAILLREWQGLSYAEIADAMSTTVSAVETLIFRARRELAAALSVEKPKPRRARLLDLLAALFGPKLAAGTALLVLGTAGVGTAVELQKQPAPRRPARAFTTPIGAAVGIAAATHAPRVAPAARVHARTPTRRAPVPTAPAARIAPPPATSIPAAQPPAPGPAPAPAAQPAPTPAAPPAPAPAASVAQPTTRATTTTPAVELPAVTVPSVTLPDLPPLAAVTVTVPVPTVPIPTGSVPQLPNLGH
jgi:RNA polymerase sigma factor (sigma-70 family)